MNLLEKNVAPIGMGCWAIGGQFHAGDVACGFPDADDPESTRTIHAALDAGIQIFDTAPVYGAGHSERLLGEALKNRNDALVVTKLGTSIDEDARQMLHDETDAADVLPAIEASLRRLQRDRIDVLLLHLNSLPVVVATPIFEEMEKARQAGKIQAYGWSTDFPAGAAAMAGMAGMDGFIGVEHTMNVFADVPSIQSTVEEHELVAFIRSPLAMGVLTGKFSESSIMASDDVRSVNSDRRDYFHNGKVASKHLKNLDAVRELLRSGGRTLAQGALGWLLAKSGRNIPLPGARTVKQIQENAETIKLGALPTDVLAEIETLIHREPEGEPRAR